MKGNFNQLIRGKQPVLVDFYADWCGPCKMQAPILKKVAAEIKDQARILKIDVDRNQALAARYQVRGVPTMILFKNGRTVWRQSGVVDKNQILQVVRQHNS